MGAVLLHQHITYADTFQIVLETSQSVARAWLKCHHQVLAGAKEELQPTAEQGQQKSYEAAGFAQDKAKSAGNAMAANFSKLGGEHCLGLLLHAGSTQVLLQP